MSSSSAYSLLALEIALKILASQHRNKPSFEMEASSSPARRLQAIASHATSGPTKQGGSLVLVLPDGGKVTTGPTKINGEGNDITLNGIDILSYTISETESYTFDISSVGTRYQGATNHIPRYKLLTLSAPMAAGSRSKNVTIDDFWVAIYAFYTLYHTQEQIPVEFSLIPNAKEIENYLLTTGLARTYPTSELVLKKPGTPPNILFLSRAAFWQGAGTTGHHHRSWLLNPKPIFPSVTAYTRNEKVIAMHPLRPSKPEPGEVLYRRWCSDVGQMLEIAHLDFDGEHDGTKAAGTGLSRHMAAFHKWHNDERVNTAWGERGSLETHREYVESLLRDPHVLPCMLSWDGELMGYVEIVYTKEDHVAQHYPQDISPGDWERGIHVLVGETKFLGGGRSEIWIRSLVHYIFLADPRSDRVIGEPNEENTAIIKVAFNSGFHLQTTIDFPYKRSVMVLNPREKFFKLCKLR